MDKRFFYGWIAAVFLACAIIPGCIPSPNDRPAHHVAPIDSVSVSPLHTASLDSAIRFVKSGDLVMRADADYESMSLQNFSQRDRSYSHSGLVFQEGNVWMVYHSIAGQENPSAILRKDTLSRFFNPARKTAIGVYRYALDSQEVNALHSYVQTLHAQKMPFDKHFNLASNDSLYCSELIYKGLRKVTRDRIVLHVSELTNFKSKQFRQNHQPVFFKRFQFIGLDDLYLHPACSEIIRLKFL